MNTISHFAGPRMDICGRIIQRCTVCGAKLCDSDGVMMPNNKDGTPGQFATFPEGRVIQVTLGNPTMMQVMPDDEKLPKDACIIGMDVQMEWQFQGDDQWVFGKKIRGIVRHPRAEVYFDEECDSPKGGWIWFAWVGKKRPYKQKRGIAVKLEWAVEECEKALGVAK